MKQILSTYFLLCFVSVSFAQSPQGIPYQSALRNNSGGVLSNQSVSIRFTIHDSVTSGTTVYQETQNTTTNNQGIVSLTIGLGTPVTGTFSTVNWGHNAKFLQIEMNVSGGSTYTDLGTQQMMSVPFALYSNSAGELKQSGSNSQTLIYTNDGF